MATIKEGMLKGLKTVAIPAALATILADSDSSNIFENVWDKAKVGGAVLGTGAAIGGAQAAHDNYTIDKMNRERLQAAQRAVLAQNNLLTTQNHKGDTVLVLPKDMSLLEKGAQIGKSATNAAFKAGFGKELTDTIADSHPVVGLGAATGAAYGQVALRGVATALANKATNAAASSPYTRHLINMGTNPATRNFSELPTYFIGSFEDSEDMMGSLKDLQEVLSYTCDASEKSLIEERNEDFLGMMYPISKSFSESKDFGIGSAIMKGLTHGVSGLTKLRQVLPGKKGAAAATAEVMGAGAENASKVGSSLAKNIRNTVTGETGKVADSVNKIADNVDKVGKTVSGFFKTAQENPQVANSMVRSFQRGATTAGFVSGAKIAKQQRENERQQQAVNQ